MTSRERLMLALNGEKPDRLPCTTMDMMKYWLNEEMGGVSLIEASRTLGLDATVFAPNPPYWPYDPTFSNETWKIDTETWNDGLGSNVRFTFTTPKGVLNMTQTTNAHTTWCTENLVKQDDDIRLLKYRPIRPFDKKKFAELYDEVGDGGIVRTGGYGFQEGPWQDACEMHGTEEMIYAAHDKPEWVHEFLHILLDHKLKFYEMSLKDLKCDLILNGGGAGSGTVISPALHEEFCLPYDKQLHAAIKNLSNLKVIYHICGGVTKIAHLIAQNGCDIYESLAPLSCGGDIESDADMAGIKKAFGGKVALMGGFDQLQLLRCGSPEQIRQEVRRLFNGFGQDGGYVLMGSDHFYHAPKENLLAYVEAAKGCIY